jgi:hypothetical protein
MLLTSNDIGISLQGGELQGIVCRSGVKVTVPLNDLSFSRGKNLQAEPFECALRELFSALVSGLKLIAPRVLFTGYLDSEAEREFVKNRIVAAGARDLFILERAMAACLGNEGPLTKKDKRIYLLWDDGVLECAALEGPQVISSIRIETERICTLNSSSNFVEIAAADNFSDQSISLLTSHLDSLKTDQFPVENPFTWCPNELPKSLLLQIVPLFSKLRPVQRDAPLKGIVEVQKELKTIIKGGFKK